MPEQRMKTYSDSYFYNHSSRGENLSKKHDAALINFIMKSDRIEKDSPAFAGIIEDVKRQQNSSILYNILMMSNVHLCIASVELPPAFKVFDAYDIRTDKSPAVFIDVTKVIELKDGYFVCKNYGKLISYLMGALTYLIYRRDTTRFMNNSNITINAVTCYVSMVDYIIEYLRIIGYSQNKEKISYLVGLFFLYNMMGKDIDQYTKNLAAKVAKVSQTSINVLDLYLEEGMFNNIDTFITSIAKQFKLKGFTTEVFINKWIYQFGNGSQYGSELFTSFSVLLTNAYCGAYIVNQKQIERCCGTAMVDYTNALLRLGVETFNMTRLEATDVVPKNTASLREAVIQRSASFDPYLLKDEDFKSEESITNKIKAAISHCEACKESSRLTEYFNQAVDYSMKKMDSYCENNDPKDFDPKIVTAIFREGNAFIKDDYSSNRKLNNKIHAYTEKANDAKVTDKTVRAERYTNCIKELLNIKNSNY